MRLFRVVCFLIIVAVRELPAQQYFPPGALDTASYGNDSKAIWYAKNLKALHEPSLWELSRDPKAEAYRFLWVRTFHHPIAARLVVRSSGSGWMHVSETSGKGGYEPGRIIRYGVSWLTKTKTESFLTALKAADFWNLPTLPVTNEGIVNLDGSQWIVEGVKNGQYHIIDRFSPDTRDPVRAIGVLALKLGRFRIRSGELY
jgi:hypothetical protein